MLIALAFAHFSSELLLKEQMIIPVKKTLNNAGHIDAKLIDFSEICQKNPAKSAVFYWLFLGEVSPRNFPWNRPIFLRICPWKSFEIWLFSAKIPRNGPIFLRILTFFLGKSRKSADFSTNFDFFPRKSREISRFFREFPPENPAKFRFFFREISEALFIVPYEFFCILSNWLTRKSFFEPITVDYLHFINNFSAVMYKRVVFLSLFEGFLFFKLITSFFYHCI